MYLHNAIFNNMTRQGHDISPLFFPTTLKVIHPKYYKHLKKGARSPKPFGQTKNGLASGRLAFTSSKTEILNKIGI